MPAIKLSEFGGMLPAWDQHLLPGGQAAFAQNCYLFSGALGGWRKPKVLRALLNASTRMVYRIPTITETQAHAYLLFLDNPSPGDTVKVSELTYTFVSALTASYDVLIGATKDDTAVNFIAALTTDNGESTNAGILYGNDTSPNSEVKFYPPDADLQVNLTGPLTDDVEIAGITYIYALLGAVDFGASFNLIKVAESTAGVRLSWLYDLNALSHTTTTYYGGSNPSFVNDITGAAVWMEFDDPDTNVIKSPVVDDQWNRYYFASPSRMPEYNTYDRIFNGDPAWLLGVPPPGCAVSLSVSGGGNNLTLGNFTGNGTTVTAFGNTMFLTPIVTPGDTQLQDVQFIAGADTGTAPGAQFAAVVYDDDSGVPGTLIGTGQIVQGVTASAANVSSFVNPINLIGNETYWIGFLVDSDIPIAGGPAGSTLNTTTMNVTFSNGPPGTAPAGTPDQAGFNMWGDFITSDVLESRAYVYTWVSAYDEEGPPSPPTLLDGFSNGTWTVGLFSPLPDDLGVLRNLKTINLYRTVPGSGGTAAFFFVKNLPIGTATYVDTAPDNEIALNDLLTSETWFPPPENLQGMVTLQNGMVAGFVDNEIWFCEPYRPHAWPPANVLTTDFPIVGLGVTSGALVVCTAAMPYIITGQTPGSLVMSKCSVANACSSRASILGNDTAVSYMSPNGLIQITPAGVATNTTDLWFTREQWQQLTPPLYARAIYLASCYFCMGSVSPTTVSPVDVTQAQRGFTIELDQDNTSFTIWPHPGGHRLGFEMLDSPTGQDILNVLTDPWTGTGLLVSDGNVWYFDFGDPAPEMQTYTWTSKLYQQNAKRNYSAMKVFFTVPPNTPTQNPTRIEEIASDTVWDTLPADSYGFIKTFVDVDGTGNLTLIDAREIRKPGELLRIVDGFKCDTFQFEIIGRILISNIQVATSAKELSNL